MPSLGECGHSALLQKYRQIPEQLVEVTGKVGTDHCEEFLEHSVGRDWVPMAFIRNVKEDTSTLEGDRKK